jgi:hypothetical protein
VEYRNRKLARIYLHEKGIPIGPNRLAELAVSGTGPPFRYWGRYAVYTEPDLDAWAESVFRTAGPNVGPAALAASIAPNKSPPLSPPTRQGRKYRPRQRARAADQHELTE